MSQTDVHKAPDRFDWNPTAQPSETTKKILGKGKDFNFTSIA